MDESMQFVSDVYFENNGEIDLLTGAMAPERFNQILARDLQLADRNLTQLSIINAKMNIEMLLGDKSNRLVCKGRRALELIST